jgi:hypothetical protein
MNDVFVPTDEMMLAKEDAFLKALVDCKFNFDKVKKVLGWKACDIRDISARDRVVVEVERLRRRMKFELEITEEKLLNEVGLVAFVDPLDVFTPDGGMRRLDEMPEAARRAIVEIARSDTANGSSVKAKLASKLEALKMLGNYFGTFVERKEISGKVDISLSAIAQEFAGRGAPPPVADHVVATLPAIAVEEKVEAVTEEVVEEKVEADFL